MDVNNTPYFLLRGEDDFSHRSGRLYWNPQIQALTLAQNQVLHLPISNPIAALDAWQDSMPLALDSFNQIGRLSADATRVEFNSGRGYLTLQDGELNDVAAPWGQFTDMALEASNTESPGDIKNAIDNGRLALPFSDGVSRHGLVLFHLARRWQTFCEWDSLEGEAASEQLPLRACIDANHRIWLISEHALMLCAGEPLPLPYQKQAVRFEPEQSNPHPLRRKWRQSLPQSLRALALCCDWEHLYMLCHNGEGEQFILTRPISESSTAGFKQYACPEDLPFAIDLEVISAAALPGSQRLAVLAPLTDEESSTGLDCPVLSLHWDAETKSGRAQLNYERYPMLSLAEPRFVASADGQVRYQSEADADFPEIAPRPRELHALRRPQFFKEGTALLQRELDSGRPDTQWHRIYLDACIPPGCEINIAVRVFASEQAPRPKPIKQPPPLWSPLSSELPFTQSLAGQQAGVSGLFEILLQQPDGPVRQLQGRYLQIQVSLSGDGRNSPALHAMRIYYPRFSYQEAYLPEFYRQEQDYDPALAFGSANAADVRERMLAAFEGMLTPVEGFIAASEQLVQPDATPAEHLFWLAETVGTQLPVHWPIYRQRRLLQEITWIQQYKGTLDALNYALDIASDGGVQRGEIVVVENFRLRRTMATILGVDMDDSDHPLTLGTGMSGNSIVGDSLILSESDARQFLALFSPELANRDETEAVNTFFEEYANQLSVLLHGRGVKQRDAVEAVLSDYLPVHLQYQIIETEHPFVLGNAPLLDVDTFLEHSPRSRQVKLDDTYLGREGILKNPAAFSPEDINALD